MARTIVAALLIGSAALSAGCKNACQQACVRMADYAEECGNPVSQDEIQICIQDQGTVSGPERDACQVYGTPDAIRTEWSCDDLAPYFEGGGAAEEQSAAR